MRSQGVSEIAPTSSPDTAGQSARVRGFILAGGESSRMGTNKGFLEIGGVPLILRTARIVESVVGNASGDLSTVVGSPELYRPLGLRAIADDYPGCGPLGGIATALHACDAEWNLVVACDLPYLTKPWLEFLAQRARACKPSAGVDAVVPMNERGAEPLCAMYRKCCEPAFREALESGTRKVTNGLARVRVEYLEPAEWKSFDSDGLLFKNMNTPADYEEAKVRLTMRNKS
jgi:molybdopterin-guanine dinucleotide biosynthesis protein A